MRLKLLHLFAGFIDTLGINGLFRVLNRDKGIILWYHGVRDDDCVPSSIYADMHLPVSMFTKQLEYLKRQGYTFVTVTDMIAALKRNVPHRKLVALTFDDGFANVIEFAYPVMKKLNAKGCLYVVSDSVNGSGLLWPDRVAVAVDNTPPGKFIFDFCGDSLDYHLKDQKSYRDTVSDIIKRVRLLPEELRRQHLAQFKQYSDVPRVLRVLTLQQLRSLDKDIMEIGSHTRNHVQCSQLRSESELEFELSGSKSVLENMTGYEVNNFCYPAGDFNDSVPAYLQKYGYLTAVTTAPGFVDQYSNPYELKRLNAAFDFNLFKAMVSGSLHILLKLNYFVRRR